MKYKIVACIPAKNEDYIIDKVLNVLSRFCYKIIVNDDNSTDNTQSICKKYDNVDLLIRPVRDPKDRQGALQRQELLDKAYEYDPDYFFFIDADELPVPDIIDFFENIDESVNTWFLPMLTLCKDENHYRVDKYVTDHGIKIDYSKPIVNKGFIVKNIKDFKLKYDINQHRCRPSNQPINSPEPHKLADERTTILHYSRLRPYYTSGQSNLDRAIWDNYTNGTNIENTLKHHQLCDKKYWDNQDIELKEIKKEWKWNI
jgi:glycosyltransferase involved in cell wall biosynthesis